MAKTLRKQPFTDQPKPKFPTKHLRKQLTEEFEQQYDEYEDEVLSKYTTLANKQTREESIYQY